MPAASMVICSAFPYTTDEKTARQYVPAAAVCVPPGDDGSVFAFADKEVTGSEVLAVTVEPSTCSDAPTTPPRWAGQVTTA